MPQIPNTFLLRGGLNLVTPALAVPAGQCTAALNYEPEVAGYRRMVGYERFDGHPSPSEGSSASDIAARRALIAAVPGTGVIRGVWGYDGDVYAFRDTLLGAGAMYKATAGGWVQQTFGYEISFNTGTAEFLEGETLVGGTSAATATIDRVVLRSGTWAGGTAAGYLVVSDVVGTFQAEAATSSSGAATILTPNAVTLPAGGRYDFVNHNFYGAAKRPRMYFANGVGTAMEWDGAVLAPIRTGVATGPLDTVTSLLARNGDTIIGRNGDTIVMRGQHDLPDHIGQFRNHLFLSFEAGSLIFSGIGEPLDYRTAAGAGEISFGAAVTGFLPSASTAFIVFGRTKVEYITGNDLSDFLMLPISDRSGAFEWTAQMAGEQPIYQDEAGLRRLGTTSAFGDWRMGSITQAIEPLFRAKHAANVEAVASLTMRSKDQYYLFFDDDTGVIIYLGRKQPESMAFLLPISVSCACSAVLDDGEGERYFVGGEDGYVYEMNRGTSFDGAEVQAYIRLNWNSLGAPAQEKRFHGVSIDVDAPDACSIGVAFHVDDAIPGNTGGARQNISVAEGSQSLISIADYDSIDWSQPTNGRLVAFIDGIGRNAAITLVSEHTTEQPHTLQAMTMNFTPRRMLRTGQG